MNQKEMYYEEETKTLFVSSENLTNRPNWIFTIMPGKIYQKSENSIINTDDNIDKTVTSSQHPTDTNRSEGTMHESRNQNINESGNANDSIMLTEKEIKAVDDFSEEEVILDYKA
jgi:hypothetical protein